MWLPDAGRSDRLLLELFGEGGGHPDPYPLFHELRELAPVHRSEMDGVWYLSRYGDCQAVLLDPRCGRKPPGVRAARPFCVEGDLAHRFTERAGRTMLWANPPDHTRLRGVLSREFTSRRVESLRARITAWVDRELDELARAGEVDLMDTFAFGLPATVMADLLAVPEDDLHLFRSLVVDPLSARADATDEALHSYVDDLIARRRRRPGDDLVSTLVTASPQGSPGLDAGELRATVGLLLEAGFVTTRHLIGNGVLAFARHPDEAERLRTEPALAAGAVEEILRYESPVQAVGRYVFEPIELGGHRIEAGQTVVALVGGANRDPDRFQRPDRFDIARQSNQPLSFGWGIHHCLGAPLARLETRIAFERMATTMAAVGVLDEEPQWLPSPFFRGLASLRVRLDRAASQHVVQPARARVPAGDDATAVGWAAATTSSA